MVFSGIPFLFYFLPLVLICYFAVPKSAKNYVLLVFSLVFYAWGEPMYVFLMMATVLVNYGIGLLLGKCQKGAVAKLLLSLGVILSLGALGYFKYADFFIENFNRITGLSLPLLRIALPIGISFYTFQILSYTVDVYRKRVAPQKNPFTLATYVSLFPQLIAGPIVRYQDVEKELISREHSPEKAAAGIRRFIVGLAKKVLLANTFGEVCDAFTGMTGASVAFYWLFALCYMLQIYFDFSAYSDMAIGLGKLFGFHFLENFNYPYIARSITDFWRRWHMSLGTWFRDYVYIPLGGNRKGKAKQTFNILLVWMLTGFWHGAQWNFIVWGLYFALLLLLEKFLYKEKLEKHPVFAHVYVLFFVAISFVIFSANNLGEALFRVGGLFGIGTNAFLDSQFFYYVKSYSLVILVGLVSATPLPKILLARLKKNAGFTKCWEELEVFFLVLLFILSTAFLVDGAFNPFLYFRF